MGNDSSSRNSTNHSNTTILASSAPVMAFRKPREGSFPAPDDTENPCVPFAKWVVCSW